MSSKELKIPNFTIPPVYPSKTSIDRPNLTPSNTGNKTYSVGRKIFEGFFLVVMNLTVVGALANLEMLRGDRSFLKREYQRVFADKEITIIKGSSSKSGKRATLVEINPGDSKKGFERTKSRPQQSSDQVDQTLDQESEHENTEDHVIEVLNNPGEEPNPLIGQQFNFSTLPPVDANGISEHPSNPTAVKLELVGLSVEVTGNTPPFESPSAIEDQSLLNERNIVAEPQSTGLLSRVGSLMNRVIGEVPEPQLHAEGTFVATIDKTEHVFTVTVKAPLTGNVSPEKLIEQEILKQLPPEITHQHLPTLKYEGENVVTSQILPSIKEEWPKTAESTQDVAMIIARLASVSILSRAVEFRLKNMPTPDTSDRALSWLGETIGMSNSLGFNPFGIACAGVYASVRALPGRTETKSLVHREFSKNALEIEDRTVTVVDPSTQKQGWLERIYRCFTHTTSTIRNVLRFTSTQNTRGIQPIYSETYIGNNGLTVRFALWNIRPIGVGRVTTPPHFNFSAFSPEDIQNAGFEEAPFSEPTPSETSSTNFAFHPLSPDDLGSGDMI